MFSRPECGSGRITGFAANRAQAGSREIRWTRSRLFVHVESRPWLHQWTTILSETRLLGSLARAISKDLRKSPPQTTQNKRPDLLNLAVAKRIGSTDGLPYVVKFFHDTQEPDLLFNEAIGSELYRAFGLPVPEWQPILVAESFLDRNSACWFQAEAGRIRPIAGLCFGSRFVGGAGETVFEILPGTTSIGYPTARLLASHGWSTCALCIRTIGRRSSLKESWLQWKQFSSISDMCSATPRETHIRS